MKQLTFDRRPSAVLKAWAAASQGQQGRLPSKDLKQEELDKELGEFQKNVTLGNWSAVKTYLATLPDEEAVIAYRQLLQNLQQRPGMGAPRSRRRR